jgi:aminopeptidase-like protein
MSRTITDIVRALFPYAYSVVSSDSDSAVAAYQAELPFSVFEVPSGTELNGWLVPNNWRVIHARIKHNGRLIQDGCTNPLGIGVLSPSFTGRLSRAELREHLYFSEECPTAVPYHWINLYRPAQKTWAFCVTKYFYDNLPEGEFEVDLVTEEFPGTMKVLDFLLPGESNETILLNGHNCHPWQANDDLSGCAVAINVLQELRKWPKRKFSYRVVIAPELIGTVHWLDQLDIHAQPIRGAIMLKSVGNDGPLRLQHSFDGQTQLDKAALSVLASHLGSFESGPFRTIYGNDETVFDSPGFEIPSISLTRFPFAEYHTDADTPDILSERALQQTGEVVLDIIRALERNLTLRFSGRGLVALSHSRYQLYRAAPAPGIDREAYLESSRKWNLLMNCLPRELNGCNSSIDLANKYGLPVIEVCEYLEQWHEKQLAVKEKIC